MFSWVSKVLNRFKAQPSIDTAAVAARLNVFFNRPIYKELNVTLIDATTDDELLQTIFDNLCEQFHGDYTKEPETFLTFTDAQKIIYIIWILQGEVNNGGFNQFYFNSSGRYAELAPAALRHIGASKLAELVTRANEIYEAEKEKITKRHDGTIEGFMASYEDNPLNELDKEFFVLEKVENLDRLQIEFIRNNKMEFISSS